MRTQTAVGLLAALLLLAACGTRLPDEAFVESQGEVSTSDGVTDGGGDVAAGEATDTADGTTETTAAGATPGATDGGSAADPGATAGGSTTGGGTGGSPASGPNQASDVGITATTITLGNITAENGVLGDAFAPAVRGLRAWTQAMNAKGGINGRTIVLKTCDDREDRSRALECARRLVEQDKVFALVATNTRAFGGAAQYLQDKGVPVIGIPITNSFYRYSHLWSGYPNGYARDGKTVGYKGQIMSLSGSYRWFKANLGVTKAAVFSYDIDESKQAGAFVAKGLELEGFQVTPYTVSFAAPSFDQAVADMQRQGVQIVFDAMDDGANRKLCDAMARRQFTVKAKVSTIVSACRGRVPQRLRQVPAGPGGPPVGAGGVGPGDDGRRRRPCHGRHADPQGPRGPPPRPAEVHRRWDHGGARVRAHGLLEADGAGLLHHRPPPTRAARRT